MKNPLKYTIVRNKTTDQRGIRFANGEVLYESDDPKRFSEYAKLARRNRLERIRREVRDSTLKDLGLVKVKGALGNTYWE